MNLDEIEKRVSEVEERVRQLGVSLARSFDNVRRDPAITCTNNRTILEYMLRDLWKRLHFKGSTERKQLEDLLAALPQKMEQLGEDAPAIPRRIYDLMRGIQLTGNRATHYPNEVIEDDAVDSLRELSEVVLWYFVSFLPLCGKTAEIISPVPPVPPVVTVTSPVGAESLKAGESCELVWKVVPGRTDSEIVLIEIELWKNGAKTATLAGRDSRLRGDVQSYRWTIPAGTTPSGNYQFKVIAWDSLGQSGHGFSSDFSIAASALQTAKASSSEMRRVEPKLEQVTEPGPTGFSGESEPNRGKDSRKGPSSQRTSRPLIVAVAVLLGALLAGVWLFSVPKDIQKTGRTKSPTPAVTPAERVLYEDDFATLSLGWGTPDEVVGVKEGKLAIAPLANNWRAALNQANVFGDADITVEATMSAGDDLTEPGGLIFWGKNYGDYYCLRISVDGRFGVSRRLNDRWLHPVEWQDNPAIKKGVDQMNQLRVVTRGRQATAYINGKEVATFSGQPPAGGGCLGLYGQSGKSPNVWQFSKLRVTEAKGGTATPTPGRVAGEQVLYEDNFATLNPGWGVPDEAVGVKDGKLTLASSADRWRAALNQSNVFDDADIAVEVTMSAGDDFAQSGGLIFWAKNYSDFYCLDVNANGRFSILRRVGDRWLYPVEWQDNPAIKKGVGQMNQLRVVTKGRQATAYINGNEVATVSGQVPAGGGCVGLYGQSGKSPNVWRFSNLRVTEAKGGTATPTPGRAAGAPVIYEDNFGAFDPGWGTPDDVRSVKDGKFTIALVADRWQAVMNQANVFNDADITVGVTRSAGDDLAQSGGLIFWGKDYSDFYCLDVSADGRFRVFRRFNNGWLYPIAWQDHPAIKKGLGEVNRLRVVARGSQATAYINDQQVATFPGQPPAGGGCVGLYGQSGKSPNTWQFSDLKVTPLSAGLLNSAVLYEDDFTTFNPGWGTPDDGRSVKDGKFFIAPLPSLFRAVLNQANVFNDADITVEAAMSAGDDLTQAGGLIFWGKDYSDYHCLNISPDGRFAIFRRYKDRWINPVEWQSNPAIKKGIGQINTLRVVTKGPQATAYINGKEVATLSVQTLEGGGCIGLHAQSGVSQNVWQFSNLRVLHNDPQK